MPREEPRDGGAPPNIAQAGTADWGGAQTAPRCPVALEYNDNQIFQEGASAVWQLHFRVRNLTQMPLHGAQLSVRGVADAGIKATDEMRVELPEPFQVDGGSVQISLEKHGNPKGEIKLRFRDDRHMYLCEAHVILRVFAADENVMAALKTINIAPSVSAGRDILGTSIHQDVRAEVTGGHIRTMNELIKRENPENWKPLRLIVTKVVDLVKHVGPLRCMKTASLVIRAPSGGERRILLLGRSHMKLGRDGDINDVVLRRFSWPASPTVVGSDPRIREAGISRRIGSTHLAIDLRNDGLYVVDRHSQNGTRLDGRPVEGEAKLPLECPSIIDVVTKDVLRLSVTPLCAPRDERDTCVARYTDLGPPDQTWELAQNLGLCGLLIERRDDLAQVERYLVVYRWVALKSDAEGGVEVLADQEDDGLQRIVRIGGRFWLQGGSTEEQPPVDGPKACSGTCQARTLAKDLDFSLDETAIRVEAFGQWGLTSGNLS